LPPVLLLVPTAITFLSIIPRLLSIPTVLLCIGVNAQSIRQEVKTLTEYWNQYLPKVQSPAVKPNLAKAEGLFHSGLNPSAGISADDEVDRIRARMYKTDPGLSASASYLENFTPSFNEDDDNLIYQRRLQAGINWDILEGGFYQNRIRSEQLNNSIAIRRFLEANNWKEDDYSLRWNQIIYVFNKSKIATLEKRRDLIESLSTEAEKLHLSRYLTREDYLRILSRKAEIDALLNIYYDYNQQFSASADSLKINADELPVPDIRYIEVLSGLDSSSRDSIGRLVARNIQLENKLISDVRLSTQLRYNYYDLVIPGNRSFFSLGVNLSIPIPFQMNLRGELNEARTKQSMYHIDQQLRGKEKELLNECYEYRYKLKQYVGFHQKFLLYEELIRRLNATSNIEPERFNPIEGLLLLDDMLAVQMEMTDIRQSLYLKLLRMYVRTGTSDIAGIAEVFSLPNYFDFDTFTNRSGYLWSAGLAKRSAQFISEYLVYNKFDKLIVSLNTDKEHKNRLVQLLPLVKKNNIDVELMIGDNELIRKTGSVATELENLCKGLTDSTINGIHLDVEPHTFSDWETEKAAYMNSYLQMLNEVRNFCNQRKWKLSVSIPLHYPEETVNKIFSICDQVIFMAYENIKPEYIDRKLLPYAGQKVKLAVAVRTKDFQNRIQIEKYLIDLYHRTGIEQIAIHDIETLISMDEKNLER